MGHVLDYYCVEGETLLTVLLNCCFLSSIAQAFSHFHQRMKYCLILVRHRLVVRTGTIKIQVSGVTHRHWPVCYEINTELKTKWTLPFIRLL